MMAQTYGYQIIGPVNSALRVVSSGSGGGSGGGVSDHGALSGLLDDDHPQYLLVDGNRQLTNNWNFGSNTISGIGDIKAANIYGDGSNLTGINHDNLDGYVANEHINWTNASQDLVTTGNITGDSIYCNLFLRSSTVTKCQIYFANDNTFQFYCGNKSYMIMNAYGDLVINEGGYNNNGLRCESDTNANMLKVDSFHDRVGIGTGSPSYTLDVNGTFRSVSDAHIDGDLLANGDISTQSNLYVIGDATTSGNVTTSGVISTEIGSAAAPAYTFSDNTTAGMYYIPGTYKALAFSMDSQELLQLSTFGRVGIGMNRDIYRTVPQASLHVYDTSTAEIKVEGKAAGGSSDAKITIMAGNSSARKASLILTKHSNMGGTGVVCLYHKQDGSPSQTFNIGTYTSNHYFRMLEFGDGHGNQVGYIGIGGVDDPQEPLHVGGNIQADGEIYCDNVVPASGVSGWYDDGSNFRVTVTNGIITDISATVSGGYSMV